MSSSPVLGKHARDGGDGGERAAKNARVQDPPRRVRHHHIFEIADLKDPDRMYERAVLDLEEIGYCVIPVLDDEELKQHYMLYEDAIRSLGTDADPANPDPVTLPGPASYGMWKCGSGFFRWSHESRKAMVPVFRKLWDMILPGFDGRMIASYDTHTVYTPHREVNALGLHVDQNARTKRTCVQSFLNITHNEHGPVTSTAVNGTFRCIPGGHFNDVHHAILSEENKANTTRNFIPLKTESIEAGMSKFDMAFEIRDVTVPSGFAVMWNSKLPHGTTGARKGHGNRIVSYVCMVPAQWDDDKSREIRVRAFNERRLTNHPPTVELGLHLEKPPRWPRPASWRPLNPTFVDPAEALADPIIHALLHGL